MRASQRETRQIVVKCCRQPAAGGVAGTAAGTEPALMIVVLLVAGITVGGGAFEYVIDMATLTGHLDMFAGQLKGEQVVIHIGRQPAGAGVASGAVCAKLTVVFIVFLVAGIAVGRRTPENMVDMTTLADYVRVFTIQLEEGQVVVEGGRRPAVRGMTEAAICAEPALVVIVFGMAGVAVLRGRSEVHNGAGVDVALPALNLNMFPGQLEEYAGVVEFMTIGIHPIVTGQAVAAEIQGMGLQEGRLDLGVAGGAGGLVKRRNVVLPVTIRAAEGGAVSFDLVGFEGVSKRFMREVGLGHVCQWGIWTAMVWVAGAAGEFGSALLHHAMQRG